MCALLGVLAPAPARARELLLWPRTPTTAVHGAEDAARREGHTLRELGPLRERLLAEADAQHEAAAKALAAVEAGLAAARRAYLEQRYDDMIAELERVEATAVAALDDEALCSATLWDIEFQLGLAHGARGDPQRARDRYALALALDPQRRPDSALYGPDVGFAFLQALDQQRPLRPVRSLVRPEDAGVRIDCRPLPALPGLRPGLHVLQVSAPGHAPEARVLELAAGAAIAAELRPEPSAPLGPLWVAGRLDIADASTRAALQRLADGRPILWLAADGDRHLARLVLGDHLHDPARGDSPGQAVTAALRPITQPRAPADKPRLTRRARLWVGLTTAALASLALGLGLGLGLRHPDSGRLQLVVP
jgi:tetratricopeptide (TPR) repeat protein